MDIPPQAPQTWADDSASSFTMSDIAMPSSTTASFVNIQEADAPPSSSEAAPSSSSEATPSSSLEGNHPFRDARVAFAVDISGSTEGPTLAAEKVFIHSIGLKLSTQARARARILPWTSYADRILPLPKVWKLESKSGTTPTAILEDSSHRRTLTQSSVWFLMTDGQIDSYERLSFARKLAQRGVHGTSCVVVIFESLTSARWSGNISVGVSVYAVVPNCAFILYNVDTGDMRLLQAKGIFRCLLRGREPPVFDEKADLTTFPPVTSSDFCDIVATMPRMLEANEIALPDSQVVNMDDLYANRLGEAEVANIFSNEENLASVIMTSQSRGQERLFQGWAQQQRMPTTSISSNGRPQDVGGAAQKAFSELMTAQRQSKTMPPNLQMQLQAAHAANISQLSADFKANMVLAQQRNRLVTQAHFRSSVPIDSAQSLSHTSRYHGNDDDDSESRSVSSFVVLPTPSMSRPVLATRPQIATRPGPVMSSMPRLATDFEHKQNPTNTTKFQPATGSYRDTCPICLTANVTMSFLFKRPPATPPDLISQNQMGTQERRPALWLGCSNQLNILSSTICCDACSLLCAKFGMSIDSKEAVYAALPLVPLRCNNMVFDVALPLVFGSHMANQDKYELLLAVVLTALGRKDLSPILRAAITWSAKDLLISMTSTWGAADRTVPLQRMGTILKESVESLKSTLLLKCDAHTFVLALRAANLLGTPLEARRATMLRRFVYSVGEGIFYHVHINRLLRREEKIKTAWLFFRPVLWESQAGSTGKLRPFLSIQPEVVGKKGLMLKGVFERLNQADELRDISGHAVAFLLHALCRAASRDDRPDDLAKMFEVFEEDSMVQKAIRSPETIGEAEVASVAM